MPIAAPFADKGNLTGKRTGVRVVTAPIPKRQQDGEDIFSARKGSDVAKALALALAR